MKHIMNAFKYLEQTKTIDVFFYKQFNFKRIIVFMIQFFK